MKLKKYFNFFVFLFCGLVPLLPMKSKIGPIPLSADFIIGSLVIFSGFLIILKKENRKDFSWILKNRGLSLLAVLIVIFSALSFFSFTYARTKGVVITEGLRFLEYVIIFYLILGLSDRKTIEKSLRIFYYSMIAASLWGVIQFTFDFHKFPAGGFFGRGRVYGTFGNPNYWGAAVNMVIFYPIINIIEKKKLKLNVLILLIFLFNLFMTSTRGSWIGFGLGLLVMGFIRYKKLVVISLGLFLSMFIIPITRSRFMQMLNINERLKLLRTGLLMFRDNKLKGVGNGNYIYEYKHYVYWHKELFLGRDKFSLHNSYLKMFVELGIFGGALFAFIYLLLLKMVYDLYKVTKNNKQWTLAFICFAVSYVVQNLSNNLMFIPQLNVFVWIISAFLLKGVYLQDKNYFRSKRNSN